MSAPGPTEDSRLPLERLTDLLAGYWRTQVVHVFARLALADRLAGGARSAQALADEAHLSVDGLERLLRAAVGLDLVREEGGGRYALTTLGATLREGKLGSLRDYALAIAGPAHWQSWAHLEDAVRTGESVAELALGSDLWSYYARQADEGRQFSRAMGNLSQLAALDLVHRHDFSGLRRIVDVGGAHGALLAAILAQAPGARGLLYDRPEVIAAAREAPDTAAVRSRIDFLAGDFFEAVPTGDAYLLKQILHDYDDAACRRLLENLRAAAAPGARLLIVEMPLPESGQRSDAALVDLNMLVLLGGRERSQARYVQLLDSTGWRFEGSLPLRGGLFLLTASARSERD